MGTEIIYGANHGIGYREVTDQEPGTTHIIRDPMLEIKEIGTPFGDEQIGGVQVGIIPPFADDESGNPGVTHDRDSGQFMTLDRDGINRAIRSLKKMRDRMYGPDA